MRLPFWIRYFDYVFNFFTSFGYFSTLREHNNAIRTIAQSLKQNGVLVLDYLNVRYAEEHLVKSEQKIVDDVVFHIEKWQDDEHFYKHIAVEDKGLRSQAFTEKVKKFSLQGFTEMFDSNGLQLQEVFGNYQFAAYDQSTSPRLIMIAKRIT